METASFWRGTALPSALAFLGLFLLPLLLTGEPAGAAEMPERPIVLPAEEPPAAATVQDQERTIRVLDGGSVRDMALDAYLLGVTAAEMPASFEPEALKAQAVAARTYTLYQLASGGNHGDAADVCTDSACCQAYTSLEDARLRWGEEADVYEQKIRAAVADTDGEVILYGGVPILAVFHASSAGLTRSAGQVWQSDLPYLRPVDSPENGETVPSYYSRVEFTAAEVKEKLLAKVPDAVFSDDKSTWLKNAVRDSAGSVEHVDAGGVTVKGSTVRGALGLRSACFEWELQDGRFVFYVTGHGHGVGLSQYGANAMAAAGADHMAILTHYYTGVTVERYGA